MCVYMRRAGGSSCCLSWTCLSISDSRDPRACIMQHTHVARPSVANLAEPIWEFSATQPSLDPPPIGPSRQSFPSLFIPFVCCSLFVMTAVLKWSFGSREDNHGMWPAVWNCIANSLGAWFCEHFGFHFVVASGNTATNFLSWFFKASTFSCFCKLKTIVDVRSCLRQNPDIRTWSSD